MLMIRWSRDRLIFNMRISTPGKTVFILRRGSGYESGAIGCLLWRLNPLIIEAGWRISHQIGFSLVLTIVCSLVSSKPLPEPMVTVVRPHSWCSGDQLLNHWGRVMQICVSDLTIIASDNGLSPDRHQDIIWTNTGILLIGPCGTNFS